MFLNNIIKFGNRKNSRCCCRNYNVLSRDEIMQFLSQNPVIIDVRNKMEYDITHVKNSINIPLNMLQNNIVNIVPNKNTKILVYCMSGVRTKQALNILEDMGYSNAYMYLDGGIMEFKELNLLEK